MKKANGIKLLTLAGLMATAACTGDFLNKNTNPDQATDEIGMGLIFAAIAVLNIRKA